MLNNRIMASTIIETLHRDGAHEEEDLYKVVKKLHENIDKSIFKETLMSLEIQGLICVLGISKNKRRIELLKG